MNGARNWWAGAAAAAVFLALGAMLDEQPSEAQDIAADVEHAHQMAVFDAQIARTSKAFCVSQVGPGARALWTVDGDLVCRPAAQLSTAGADE